MTDEDTKKPQEAEEVNLRGRNAMAVASYMKNGQRKEKARKNKRKRRKRKVAEHRGLNWFAIERMFDPMDIDALPIRDSGYMLGTIDDMLVVEMPSDIAPQKMRQVGAALGAMGVKCIMVPKGTRFLQLRGCTKEEEDRLNSIVKDREAQITKMIEEGTNGENGTPSAS